MNAFLNNICLIKKKSMSSLNSNGEDPFLQMPSNIKKIDLSHQTLKTLPDHVFDRFYAVEELNLSHCGLTKLPQSLFKLKNLKSLDISFNQLDLIPVEIGQLLSLTSLNVEENPGLEIGDLRQKNSNELIAFFQKIMEDKKVPELRKFDPQINFNIVDKRRTFSILSYNILSAKCAKPIRFPFTPQKYLDASYRIPLILNQLDSFRPDIICLQEVEGGVFNRDLVPYLKSRNYEGFHCPKGRVKTMFDDSRIEKVLGQATFICKKKFSVVGSQSLDLRNHKMCKSLNNYNDMIKHDETIIITVIKSKIEYEAHIVVVNVHLYWPADAAEVRTSQLYLSIIAANEYAQSLGITSYDILLAGDFNSWPRTQPLYFLRCNMIDQFYNVYEMLEKLPEFTQFNYNHSVPIDYIFTTLYGIFPISVLPFGQELCNNLKDNYCCLPGQHYPSDHIPIASIFHFKDLKYYPAAKFIPVMPEEATTIQQEKPKETHATFNFTKPKKGAKLQIVTKS